MQKEFSLSNGKATINFSAKYCDTEESLLNSYAFRTVLREYLNIIRKRESNIFKYVEKSIGLRDEERTLDNIIGIFKLLVIFSVDEIQGMDMKYSKIVQDREKFVLFVEELYSFWRRIERYTIVQNNKIGEGLQNVSFTEANSQFSNLILKTYRQIKENVEGVKPRVYRQLPAGGNAGFILNNIKWPYPEDYKCLDNIPFIESIVLDPPFIIYPKKNKRDGIFTETDKNPLKECTINIDHWFCFPAKVGSLLAYIYFHRDFMGHGVALCNLFELAMEEEYKDRKPDLVYVFGCRDNSGEVRTIFYDDKDNDIILGYVNYNEDIDYFGYMKKMVLTLHNVKMIKEGRLPIHGAMVNITTKDNKTANIVIMGDSGAGKSESIEALRELSEDYISDMSIIFDDMGVMALTRDNKLRASGTEIGAFVRLDDLETGYAFKQIDRSIFMNPDKINARLVIPISSYQEITTQYPVDLFLYANNYEEGEELQFFDNAEEALSLFKRGTRMAKGTTTEMGLVNTYFANPFGPEQKMEETDKLLSVYFQKCFDLKIKVGQIRTRLGIAGMEKEGPKRAAVRLLEFIKNM